MAITIDDFSKIWASTSPLTPYSFSDSNYQEGWNFIGGTPPSRQMWDFLQKNNDEKMQYLANNYLPLSGGTMTGAIKGDPITLTADDGNGNTKDFVAESDGTLTWNGNDILTNATVGTVVTNTSNNISITSGTAKVLTSVNLSEGVWVVTGKSQINTAHAGNYGIRVSDATGFSYDADNTYAITTTAANQMFCGSVTSIFNLSTPKTINLVAYTSAGNTTSLNNYLYAVRIV